MIPADLQVTNEHFVLYRISIVERQRKVQCSVFFMAALLGAKAVYVLHSPRLCIEPVKGK